MLVVTGTVSRLSACDTAPTGTQPQPCEAIRGPTQDGRHSSRPLHSRQPQDADKGFANHGTASNSGQGNAKFAPLESWALAPCRCSVGWGKLHYPRLPELKMADPDGGCSRKGEAVETWARRGIWTLVLPHSCILGVQIHVCGRLLEANSPKHIRLVALANAAAAATARLLGVAHAF